MDSGKLEVIVIPLLTGTQIFKLSVYIDLKTAMNSFKISKIMSSVLNSNPTKTSIITRNSAHLDVKIEMT